MSKVVAVFVLVCIGIPAQVAKVTQLFYDASARLQYVCTAPQIIGATPTSPYSSTVQKSDSSLTNIVVSTGTATVTTLAAHGVWVGMRVTVLGSATAALNGTYTVLTVPSTTTYTFTTAAGDATYTDAALQIGTNNPLLTQLQWVIQVSTYNATSQLIGTYSAAGAQGNLACTDRTKY